ncbi:PTS sugar transporter subunit IIA [Vagococcus sp.]|uniref:PTS sugar transporter subunit IIA n=1 Tax=Vagococcus sp. TaxID=1933889 RepID=UPI003F98B076
MFHQFLKDELSDYLYTVPDHKKITLATKKLKLFDLLHDDSIQLQVQANRWEEALYLSSLPLLEKKYITRNYIEKIIQTVKNEGPYMLISKNVALSHASPKDGVNQNCLSITVLSDPITIGTHSNNPVKYIFTLAVTNQNSHLHAMSELVKLLSDQNFYTLLNKANQPNQVIDWIKEKLYLPV